MGDEEASGGAARKKGKTFHDTDKPVVEAPPSSSVEDCGPQKHIAKLDLVAIARGEASRAGVAIESARRAAEKLRGQGNVGAARLLEEHIELAAAANELGKHQDATMPKDEFDLAADMLTAAGVLLPQKTCLLALRALGRLSGPGSEKAPAAVVEAFWPECPLSASPFRHRQPFLREVPEMTPESSSKFFTELAGVVIAQLLEACGEPEGASAQTRTRLLCETFDEKFISSSAGAAPTAECLKQFSPAPRLTASHVADNKN